MIDEELYQQAADELNSDRRRPHIWARACALASDDHDEARFLYTNLRVEELLSEREQGIISAGSLARSAVVDEDNDDTLALTPIDDTVTDDELQGFMNDLEISEDENIHSSVSAPSGKDLPESAHDSIQLEPLAFESAIPDSELPAMEQPDIIQYDEPDEELMADYVPEDHDLMEDTFSGDTLVEEEFAKELETFKEEEGEIAAEPAAEPDYVASTRTGVDAIAQMDVDLKLEDADSGMDMTAQIEDATDLTASNPADLTQANIGVLDAHASELDDMLGDARYKPAEPEVPDHNMDWLEDEVSDSDVVSEQAQAREPEIYETDPFADELSRQADELDLGQEDDRTADHSQHILDELEPEDLLPELEDPATEPAEPGSEDDEYEQLLDDAPAHDNNPDPAIPAAASVAASTAAMVAVPTMSSEPDLKPQNYDGDLDRSKFPLDLTTGHKGTLYSVYRRDTQARAVKSGVSWSALFFTLPYLLYRQLFGTALAYSFLWIVAVGGLVLSGLAWFDAGENVAPVVQASTIGFGLLAFIGLIYLPFRYANSWRSEKLEMRGFDRVALTKAKNPGRAIARARRHAALDA